MLSDDEDCCPTCLEGINMLKLSHQVCLVSVQKIGKLFKLRAKCGVLDEQNLRTTTHALSWNARMTFI